MELLNQRMKVLKGTLLGKLLYLPRAPHLTDTAWLCLWKRLGQSVTATIARVTTSAMFYSLEVTLCLHAELYMTCKHMTLINPVVLQQFSL